ncbi:MAG: leucyl aminopeptidase [Pirellulaceae bacterium]|nr:leucyl aminopeptidase [Pirellulaceae bacterium]
MLKSLPLPAPKLQAITDPAEQNADVLIVGIDDSLKLSGTLQKIDAATGTTGDGCISRMIHAKKILGKPGELTLLAAPSNVAATMVLLVGLGPRAEISRGRFFQAASAAIRKISDQENKRVIIALGESCKPRWHDAIVAGALFGCEGEAIYVSEPRIKVPDAIHFSSIDPVQIDRGRVIGESVNHTRRLVNEPPSVIYPESFARRATEIAQSVGLDVEVWDEKKLAEEGCRAMLAVGAGSSKPPRLVILRHNGGGSKPPVALVGKGVTFDSGGLSLKPSESMKAMKCDMAGAATVVGVMRALAELGVKRNVIGFCGLAENMVSGDSYKLGDVIKTRNGKTIEILNTDAEGRVVLADTLDVAIGHTPVAMIDLATLTGACMVALGTEVAGLMTNQQVVCESIASAAHAEGEPAWQLPMYDLYDDKVKSKVADIRNIGEGRWGGAITAAKFLENFVGDVPWVHIDIAGPAFADSPLDHRDAGATGVMVRSLIRWVESISE